MADRGVNFRDPRFQVVGNKTVLSFQSLEEKRNDAALLDWFYSKNRGVIHSQLKDDLDNYIDGGDISRMILISLDEFIAAFMNSLLHVYDSSPVVKWTEAELDEEGNQKEEPDDLTKFRALLDEVDWVQAARDSLTQCRLHNTSLSEVKYNDDVDEVFIDTGYNIGNSWVVTYPGYFKQWQIFAYEIKRDGNKSTWIVWDKEGSDGPENYLFVTNSPIPKFDPDKTARLVNGNKLSLPGNKDLKAPNYGGDQSAPIVTYRFDKQDGFWGNSMNFLTDLERTVNVLLTVTNDDTVQETIRLLILNFDPVGTEGQDGYIKGGLRHPIVAANAAPGSEIDPKGTVVSADLYNEAIMQFIGELMDITANMFEVDNPIRNDIEQSLSGIALKIRAEPMIRNWSQDITKVRKPDKAIFKALIDVNNLNRSDNLIDVKILEQITVDYVEPTVVTNEAEEDEAERKRWKDGTSNPILWVMRKNPEFTETDARDFIKQNKTITTELQGPAIVPLREDLLNA